MTFAQLELYLPTTRMAHNQEKKHEHPIKNRSNRNCTFGASVHAGRHWIDGDFDMTNKIKLSPEQEAFAFKIEATHCLSAPNGVKYFAKFDARSCYVHDIKWFCAGRSDEYIADAEEIDFTQSKEVYWKALAKELFDAIDGLEIGYELISDDDSDLVIYEGRLSAGSLRKAEQALQRAKEAGL